MSNQLQQNRLISVVVSTLVFESYFQPYREPGFEPQIVRHTFTIAVAKSIN